MIEVALGLLAMAFAKHIINAAIWFGNFVKGAINGWNARIRRL